MRSLLLLLLLSPPSLAWSCGSDCGDCTELHKEIEKERLKDEALHACRSCKQLETVQEGCPPFGFECDTDWDMTVSGLSETSQQCIETKCVGPAQLAVGGKIVNKVRCNDTHWLNGKEEAAPAVCALPCNSNACKRAAPSPLPDFSPITVHAADAESEGPCATGDCANGMVAVNADGSPIYQLDFKEGVSSVQCTSSGQWAYGMGEGRERHQYVMCNKSPCGPTRCPAFIMGESMMTGESVPLTITGNGAQCATATCEVGYNVMTTDGTISFSIGSLSLTCQADGKWKSAVTTYDYVMCVPPPCPGRCNEVPFTSRLGSGGTEVTLNAPIRLGCDYSCPDDQALFRLWNGNNAAPPVSVEQAHCEFGLYRTSPATYAGSIGCWKCDLEDQEITADSEVKPQLTQCMLWCPTDYEIEYYHESTPEDKKQVLRLYRQIFGQNPQDPSRPRGEWFDESINNQVDSAGLKINCVAV